jgi:hypothetical protein
MVTSIANLIAFNNLNEIFTFEILRSLSTVGAGTSSAKYDGALHYTILSIICCWAIGMCIWVMVKFRKERCGYEMKKLLAVGMATSVIIASLFSCFAVLSIDKKQEYPYLSKLLNPAYSLEHFTNRSRALYNFGSPTFYFNNILSLIGFKTMRAYPVSGEGTLDGADYYEDYVDEDENPLMLDSNYNVIMIMMETLEAAAINDIVMPGLFNMRKKTTWVDGYYSIQRTCFTEFLSMTGGSAMGAEMWRDFQNVYYPQSLPNTFRRSYLNANERDGVNKAIKIGAYHPYSAEFYSRKFFFDNLGFDAGYPKSLLDYGQTVNPDWQNNDDLKFMENAVAEIAPTNTRFFNYFLNITTHGSHFVAPKGNDGKPDPNCYGAEHIWLDNSIQIHSAQEIPNQIKCRPEYQVSLDYIKSNFATLKTIYPKLESTNVEVRAAAWAYITACHHYDRALGYLFNYLNTAQNDDGSFLIDTTALVFYSDHYNYTSYNNPKNAEKGGLLSTAGFEHDTGEKLGFMIYNPKDRKCIDRANPESPDYNPEWNGRRIDGFASNSDVYKTVAHLFNIETNDKFTLGESVLARLDHGVGIDEKDFKNQSVGIGYLSGDFFGRDIENPSLLWITRDFKTYTTNSVKKAPSQKTITEYKSSLNEYAATLLTLRSYYDSEYDGRKGQAFNNDPTSKYIMAK